MNQPSNSRWPKISAAKLFSVAEIFSVAKILDGRSTGDQIALAVEVILP